uniref:Uncharacterized protein n=1 Tax=Schistosoma japonicum TaxID=6182 RepID=Q5C123_SCHJA|nr:unknown [Schistosoma japonicum]
MLPQQQMPMKIHNYLVSSL